MSDSATLFITGLSGAGMSSALKALEDLGYEVFDNFPLSLVDTLLQEPHQRPMAIGIDTRTRGFDPQAVLEKIKGSGAPLIFMTCDEAVLQKRFTETRRRHPLAADRPVGAGIKKELSLLYPLRETADLIVDTSELSIHDLKRIITGYAGDAAQNRMTVTVLSFGYKNGLPREADIVMDLRFLSNPHWIEELKPLTGRDSAVQDYIERDPAFHGFLENFKTMINPLLEKYRAEGKSYLTLAFGCTGGKHRSVFVAEKITEWMQQKDIAANIEHRDLERS